MNKNLLIGAISGNYSISDIKNWAESSRWVDVDRTLLIYNSQDNPALIEYLTQEGIDIITPDFDFFGRPLSATNTDTGNVTLQGTYDLVHNLRFFHISQYLESVEYQKVFTTDVKDVYFNSSPFDKTPDDAIIATGEVVKYNEHDWNTRHLLTNLGLFGHNLLEEEVYNVGVFGGGKEQVKALCRDIYLLSCGKPLVADQTSFNYLIRNSYKDKTTLTSLEDKFTVHLHVIKEGVVKFNLEDLKDYTVVHQYDRFGNEILNYYTLPK